MERERDATDWFNAILIVLTNMRAWRAMSRLRASARAAFFARNGY